MKPLHFLAPLFALSLLTACGPFGGDDAEEEMEEMQEEMMEEAMEDDADDAAMMKKEPAEAVADCGSKNAVCETHDDCCEAMGLECKQVRTSDGGFGKRCLPFEVEICKVDCDGGVWSDMRGCRTGVAPKGYVRCDTLVGEMCKESVNVHRNTKECTDT